MSTPYLPKVVSGNAVYSGTVDIVSVYPPKIISGKAVFSGASPQPTTKFPVVRRGRL